MSPDICGDVDEAARKEDKEEEQQVNRIVKKIVLVRASREQEKEDNVSKVGGSK